MDTFDLKWPRTDATFYTDGWRCRIVWREKRGGMGGTIDNNDQCKKRAASSLLTAPYLLNALRARGHGVLAEEIESIAGDGPQEDTGRSLRPAKTAKPAARKETDPPIRRWLGLLEGQDSWEQVAVRRAKVWQPCAELADETLALKAPAVKGKPEWVLKQTFADRKRKAQYIAAQELKGICCYLHERGLLAGNAAVEQWLTRVEVIDHPAVAQAAAAWRKASTAATH